MPKYLFKSTQTETELIKNICRIIFATESRYQNFAQSEGKTLTK